MAAVSVELRGSGPTRGAYWPRRRAGLAESGAIAGQVRAALGHAAADVADWDCRLLRQGVNAATGASIAGTAAVGDAVVPWSLILKVARAGANALGDSADPADASYWRREPLLYRSGILDALPGIRAPRCYGVAYPTPTAAWLWLEDVAGPAERGWSAARFATVARRLGRFNGAYLAGRPLPTDPVLSRDWLRASTARAAAGVAGIPGALDHTLARRCYPGDLSARIPSLAAERGRYLAALGRLPQTFCHQDAFTRNMFLG
jgi:hypothetical protein